MTTETAPSLADGNGLPTPQELLTDLGELHTRTCVSPLPKHPAAMGWQATAGCLAAGFARALHALSEVAPEKAAEITSWFQGPFEDGPDPEEHTDWLEQHVAGSPETVQRWVDEGRQMAEESKANTEAWEKQHQEESLPGAPFTPTVDDMEGEYAGVLVSSLGEDGASIAVTGVKEKALEALDSCYRQVCGQPNLLDDASRPLADAYYYLNSGHALFARSTDGGWTVTAAPEDAPGAVPVTWFGGSVFGPLPQPYSATAGLQTLWEA